MLSRKYLLLPLIVVLISACNGGGDSAGSPQEGLTSAESVETLGSLDSLSGFALSFDNRSSAEMSEKLKLAQSEMDRVQLVSSEQLSEIRKEQLLLERQ